MIDDVSSLAKRLINQEVLQEIRLELKRLSLSDRKAAERWERLLNNNWDKKLEGLQKSSVQFEPVDRYPIIDEWDNTFGVAIEDEDDLDEVGEWEDSMAPQLYSRWADFKFMEIPPRSAETAWAEFAFAQKEDMYLFFDKSEDVFHIIHPELLREMDIGALWRTAPEEYKDMYFFSPKHRWTFVIPSDRTKGPFFLKRERF